MPDTHIKNIPGKILASRKEIWLEEQVKSLSTKPKLKIVQVGGYAPSTLYTSLKARAAQRVGIDAEVVRFEDANLTDTARHIVEYNDDPEVMGIMLQAPMPVGALEHRYLFDLITPEKDVDGLTTTSLGNVWELKSLTALNLGNGFIAATPLAVLDCLYWVASGEQEDVFSGTEQQFKILRSYLAGKKVLIINRSTIVGKPLAALLLGLDATVTLAHSKSVNLTTELERADVIMTAAGVPGLFSLANLKETKVVIDISISQDKNGKVAGDVVDFTSQLPHVIAAVPGGVGPLTVVNLLYNTYLSANQAMI